MITMTGILLFIVTIFVSALLFMAACQLFLGDRFFIFETEEQMDKDIQKNLAILRAREKAELEDK